LLNTKIVATLHSNGIDAIGLTGIDKGLFVADYLDKDLGFVGNPKFTGKIDWLTSLLKENIIPVFSSICRDNQGNLMNVNADLFTKELALALNADTVFFLSDVEGVMIKGEKKSPLTYDEIVASIEQKEIYGGMIPKLQSCLELIEKGINKVWIGNDLSNFNFTTISGDTKGSWIVERLPNAVNY
jgi:acetylglutamate kinase